MASAMGRFFTTVRNSAIGGTFARHHPSELRGHGRFVGWFQGADSRSYDFRNHGEKSYVTEIETSSGGPSRPAGARVNDWAAADGRPRPARPALVAADPVGVARWPAGCPVAARTVRRDVAQRSLRSPRRTDRRRPCLPAGRPVLRVERGGPLPRQGAGSLGPVGPSLGRQPDLGGHLFAGLFVAALSFHGGEVEREREREAG